MRAFAESGPGPLSRPRGQARPGPARDSPRAAGAEQLLPRQGGGEFPRQLGRAQSSENPVGRGAVVAARGWAAVPAGTGNSLQPHGVWAALGNPGLVAGHSSKVQRVLQPFPSLTDLPFSGKWGQGAAFIPVGISASPALTGVRAVAHLPSPWSAVWGCTALCQRARAPVRAGPQGCRLGERRAFKMGLTLGSPLALSVLCFISVSTRFKAN